VSSPEFWIFPIAILGACVGSFLNVVIYRLPRGLSVAHPRWSFCPNCEHRIRPSDNIPLLGWLRLSGKCRDCGNSISPVYPLIEGLTAILFVAIWDAVFIARAMPHAATEASVPHTWPIALSMLFLFSTLMAMSVMDLETYTVDIRLCNLAVVVGIVCQMAWGVTEPRAGMLQIEDALPPVVVVASVAAFLGWATLAIARRAIFGPEANELDVAAPEPIPIAPETGAPDAPPAESASPTPTEPVPTVASRDAGPAGILLLTIFAIGLSVWVYSYSGSPAITGITAGQVRGIAVLFVFMTSLIAASMVPREADAEVVAEIESQRASARSMAVRELAGFATAIVAAAAAVWWLGKQARIAEDWTGVAGLPFVLNGNPVHASWVLGLHCVAAAVLAAALGWVVRILGTLAFGKEAFGTGDIYILAAIGAGAGFWIAFIGFFLAAFLALAGVAILLFRRRAKAVPFGPWLALGAFLALYVHAQLAEAVGPVLRFLWSRLVGLPDPGY